MLRKSLLAALVFVPAAFFTAGISQCPTCDEQCTQHQESAYEECISNGFDEETCQSRAEAAYEECMAACEDGTGRF